MDMKWMIFILKSLKNWAFGYQKERLYQDDLRATLCYYRRLQRSDPQGEEQTPSWAGSSNPLAFSLWNEREGPSKRYLEIG